MPIISTPSQPVLTPEQIEAQEIAAVIAHLANIEAMLAGAIATARRDGSASIYGRGQVFADKVFAALGSAGVDLVKSDLLQREILNLSTPGSGTSPVPADMDIIPLDAQGNPTADLNAAARMKVVAKENNG